MTGPNAGNGHVIGPPFPGPPPPLGPGTGL
jgi:hypothetical protein